MAFAQSPPGRSQALGQRQEIRASRNRQSNAVALAALAGTGLIILWELEQKPKAAKAPTTCPAGYARDVATGLCTPICGAGQKWNASLGECYPPKKTPTPPVKPTGPTAPTGKPAWWCQWTANEKAVAQIWYQLMGTWLPLTPAVSSLAIYNAYTTGTVNKGDKMRPGAAAVATHIIAAPTGQFQSYVAQHISGADAAYNYQLAWVAACWRVVLLSPAATTTPQTVASNATTKTFLSLWQSKGEMAAETWLGIHLASSAQFANQISSEAGVRCKS